MLAPSKSEFLSIQSPRISVVDYINEGLTIYIFSEGGDKFKKP
jgi:hypothetical protein